MDNLLHGLYFGDIHSFFELPIRSERYKNAQKKLNALQDKITEEHPECAELFAEYLNLQTEALVEAYFQQFLLGVRVGGQLMEEIKKSLE